MEIYSGLCRVCVCAAGIWPLFSLYRVHANEASNDGGGQAQKKSAEAMDREEEGDDLPSLKRELLHRRRWDEWNQ